MCNEVRREMGLCREVMRPAETNAASWRECPAVGDCGIRLEATAVVHIKENNSWNSVAVGRERRQ